MVLTSSKSFGELISEDKIFLLNDSDCVALSHVLVSNIPKTFPALSIYIDAKAGATLIKQNGIINYNHAFRPIKSLNNKRASYLLCDRGIDDILFNEGFNISFEYTLYLSEVLKDILNIAKGDGHMIQWLLIHSTKSEYILHGELKKKFPSINFHFTNGDSVEKHLPLDGALRYLETLKSKESSSEFNIKMNNKGFLMSSIPIIGFMFRPYKIDYYNSNEEKITSMNNFDEFISHWRKSKPISLGNTYYIIHYLDSSKLKIYLDTLNSIVELQKYKF